MIGKRQDRVFVLPFLRTGTRLEPILRTEPRNFVVYVIHVLGAGHNTCTLVRIKSTPCFMAYVSQAFTLASLFIGQLGFRAYDVLG